MTKYTPEMIDKVKDSYMFYDTAVFQIIKQLQGEITNLTADNQKMHDQLIEITEAFTSQSLTDDIEMANTAREIAEILGIKNYR